MSNRTETWNAYETTLSSILNPGVLFVDFTSVANLNFPVYVTLAPENPSLLEYLKIIDIQGNTVEFEQRNLEGSAGDGTHQPGTIVRLTWTKQLQDDIFDDIEALEAEDVTLHAADAALAAADAAHVAAGDPHPVYVNDSQLTAGLADKVDIGGDTMTGELALPAGSPSGATIATNKAYVDAQISGGGLPSGTRMVFDQASAPAGWTRDTSTVDDKVIRIVTGARADGGSWTHDSHSHTNSDSGFAGSHEHLGPAHTHSGPSHSHNVGTHNHTNPSTSAAVGDATAQEDGGSNFSYAIGSHTHTQGNTGPGGPGSTFADGTGLTGVNVQQNTDTEADHQHTQNDTGDSATPSSWRPLHRDMIIAVKD